MLLKKGIASAIIFLREKGPQRNMQMLWWGEPRPRCAFMTPGVISSAECRRRMHRIALQYFRGGIAIGNVGDLEGTGKGSPTQHANVVVGRAEASLRFYDAGRHQ